MEGKISIEESGYSEYIISESEKGTNLKTIKTALSDLGLTYTLKEINDFAKAHTKAKEDEVKARQIDTSLVPNDSIRNLFNDLFNTQLKVVYVKQKAYLEGLTPSYANDLQLLKTIQDMRLKLDHEQKDRNNNIYF